jgi:hypothetical protein
MTDIIYKDRDNARTVAPNVDHDARRLVRESALTPLDILLCRSDPATAAVAEGIIEFIGKMVGRERRTTNAKIAALEKKIAAADARSALIEVENANLRTEIADLTHRFERDRATRGVTDGASLPASLLRKNRAAAKGSR